LAWPVRRNPGGALLPRPGKGGPTNRGLPERRTPICGFPVLSAIAR
jgi:hypothetical protein